jgi:hypothetical protein
VEVDLPFLRLVGVAATIKLFDTLPQTAGNIVDVVADRLIIHVVAGTTEEPA